MKRLLTALAAMLLAAVAALTTATPANALAITAGFMITSGGRWCTVSFPDPKMPNIVYTAGHCYHDGITEVNLGNIQIGQFIPEIHDRTTDLIAIRLYSNVPSEYSLMSREPLLDPWVPNTGSTVCKYGATTQETCGTVLSVDDTKFAVQMPADHGDSGAPIYERLNANSKGVHVVGTVISEDPRRPGVIYCTTIGAIRTFLTQTWGTSWDMD
ncbi:hypothetical protein [Mycobacterium avium]|uniref:Trypsin n=1 Tax=Mycobacterium avium subsp. hominissuis TaxID=439334 RepID=A0AAI8STL5_MYCAV|nr:hypothetical protein [Mycobacterium avium]PBA08599.1 hypothetical protein CKJ70_25510 [Mycobacterium avium]BBN50906.1 hypothetical protein JPH1_53810 [Mycobacterium avium subsp. hominissuis]